MFTRWALGSMAEQLSFQLIFSLRACVLDCHLHPETPESGYGDLIQVQALIRKVTCEQGEPQQSSIGTPLLTDFLPYP